MTAGAPAIRRVRVAHPSARTELGRVAGVGAAIVIAAALYLGVTGAVSVRGRPGSQLLPFQALVMSRPETDQRMFRELQEGLLEAEARRGDAGVWPAVSDLAAEGIPPFAFDPTAPAPYTWHLIREGAIVNYLGIPERTGMPAWLLHVEEALPTESTNAVREDQGHHRLLTGELLYVSTWVRGDGQATPRFVPVPQSEGWTELLAVEPSFDRPAAASQPATTP